MIINIVLGCLIFGYAGWTLMSYVKKSKKGKCAACSMNKSCQVSCDPQITRGS